MNRYQLIAVFVVPIILGGLWAIIQWVIIPRFTKNRQDPAKRLPAKRRLTAVVDDMPRCNPVLAGSLLTGGMIVALIARLGKRALSCGRFFFRRYDPHPPPPGKTHT